MESVPNLAPRDPLVKGLARVAGAWRWLALGAFLGGAGGVAAYLALPAWYESASVLAIVPAADDPGAAGQANANENAELPMFAAVLNTRRVADETVSRLGLVGAWKVATPEDARRVLRAHLVVVVDRKADLITVRFEDRRPDRARQVVAAITAAANDVHAQLWTSRVREHRRHLEERLAQVARALAAAERAMETFRSENRVVALDEQIKASVEAAATLDKLRVEKELGLHFATGFGNADSPDVQRARRELAGARRALRKLFAGSTRAGSTLPLEQLPRLESEHARLKRDIEVNRAAYDLLEQRIEQLTVVELRSAGRAEVVDPPSEPRHPHRPARGALAVEGIFCGVIIVALFVLAGAWRKVFRQAI